MRGLLKFIQKLIANQSVQELLLALKKKINTAVVLVIHLKDSTYEYFYPLFEMWDFWLRNPWKYVETLQHPFDNPWWSAAATLPSFIGMIIHLIFWVINPAITDYIIMNFIW